MELNLNLNRRDIGGIAGYRRGPKANVRRTAACGFALGAPGAKPQATFGRCSRHHAPSLLTRLLDSVLRLLTGISHLDDLGIEAGDDIHQIALRRHDGVDVLVGSRRFVNSG